MQLEDYFVFLAPDDIRLKGHRIGIENILYEYIHRAQTPEEIARRFDTLNLEQIHATILYYLQNKQAIDRYMSQWVQQCRQAREEQQQAHPEFAEKLRRLKAERATEPQTTP